MSSYVGGKKTVKYTCLNFVLIVSVIHRNNIFLNFHFNVWRICTFTYIANTCVICIVICRKGSRARKKKKKTEIWIIKLKKKMNGRENTISFCCFCLLFLYILTIIPRFKFFFLFVYLVILKLLKNYFQ